MFMRMVIDSPLRVGIIGASGFTAASPVTIPTLSAPKVSHSAKNFSLTSALSGAV